MSRITTTLLTALLAVAGAELTRRLPEPPAAMSLLRAPSMSPSTATTSPAAWRS